ncbi:helix-turn-helix domain-containing protein [Gracilimonas mengyeensis]|uniref:Transcriptional regulator, AraC family n=1 Tax=Gracilimonas mengyeensis TaxID=1302730 RepID=A0A521AT46_9BACT|nr:AraC family transcriptional regulator [Gracilimonas mengyeensis]SMO37993.1 transcriptional regulator, AraC family [Gracilimonas mengyeensis]
MITNHQKIEFGEVTLIEKVSIKPPFRLSFNFPDEACFIYFDKGSTQIKAPYEQKEVHSKEAVLLRCGTYFSELLPGLNEESYTILVFHLPKKVIREIYQEHFPVSAQAEQESFIRKVDPSSVLEEFINGIQSYFHNRSMLSDELLKLKIQELILLLQKTGNTTSLRKLFNETFSPVEVNLKQVVHSHIFTDCTVSDLAELCNMSLSTFNRQFRKVFDDSPSNYLKNKRLDKAKELLLHSSFSIGEIAFKTCFYDAAHLSNSFKDKFGCSPSDYRKNSNE